MLQPEGPRRRVTILLADDDEEDRELTRDALREAHLANEVLFVVDGQDLMGTTLTVGWSTTWPYMSTARSTGTATCVAIAGWATW